MQKDKVRKKKKRQNIFLFIVASISPLDWCLHSATSYNYRADHTENKSAQNFTSHPNVLQLSPAQLTGGHI